MITGQLMYKAAEYRRVRIFVTITTPEGAYVGLETWYGLSVQAICAAVAAKHPRQVLQFGRAMGVD